MSYWILNLLSVLLLSIVCAGFLIPQILLISFRKKLFDEPDERKIHKDAVPRLGGIAFKPVMFFSVVLVVGVNYLLGYQDVLALAAREINPLIFGFCSLQLIYLVGIADDLIGIRYSAKFLAQVFSAALIIAGGVCIADLHGVLFIHGITMWLAWPVTALAIVFIINAINLIDGIDGLASGLCSVACTFYGVMFFMLGEYFYAILSAAGLGVLLPFFYYNVFGNPKRGRKIFMGDTGSLTIGTLLCFLSISLLCRIQSDNVFAANPAVCAFAPLIVPCFDVVRVYIHRVKRGRNPFLPDKNHIHHKLLALGIGQHTAMVSILLFSFMLTLANILLARYLDVNVLLLADILLYTAINIWLSRRIKKGTDLPR